MASVYARLLHGRKTASGEIHDGNDFTAAHRTLPLGTLVKVTNLANHRSVIVRINDRGPQPKSRIIDLSPSAGAQIGLRARGKGLARVRLEVVPHEVAQAGVQAKP
ncbi:MAG TPA: septal ring lytic transglycosylase RlpA family protein [Casimicrobiaceae bacterium]|nr:septal ring lytic transglycosylase RlpA family protein [Casimicrobiaceae bacterium]